MKDGDHPQEEIKKQRISPGIVILGIIYGVVFLVYVPTFLHVFFVSILDIPNQFYLHIIEFSPFCISLIIFLLVKVRAPPNRPKRTQHSRAMVGGLISALILTLVVGGIIALVVVSSWR